MRNLLRSKNIFAFIFLLFLSLGLCFSGWGQIPIYSENFGIATTFPTGWSTSGQDNWTISNANNSSGYIGASGGSNAESPSKNNQSGTLYSKSISTVGYTNISVLWAARMPTYSSISPTLEWSDGVTWTSILFTDIGNTSTWGLVNGGVRISLTPSASNLPNLQFRWYINDSRSNYKIDDFSVQGCQLPSQPTIISGSITPCLTSSQTYSVNNDAGVTYTWVFPAGWTQTVGGTTNSVTVTVGAGSGNVQVTPSNACGDGTARTLAVTVNTIPTITGTTIGSRCGTGTVTLGASASAGTINWYSASTLGSSLGTGTSFTTSSISSTTSYWVDATNNGCTTASRTEVTATINAIPTITGTLTVNSGSTIQLTASTSGGTWSSGTPSVATVNSSSGLVSGVSAGTSIITYTGANGCSKTATITVTTGTSPTITSFSPTSACLGNAASIVIIGTNFTGVTAVNFNGVSASYTVDSSTQITATLPTTASTGTISVTTSSGIETSSSNFTVNAIPTVSAGSAFTKTCSSNTSGATIGESNDPTATYSWAPTAGLSSPTVSNPTANPDATTSYTVTKTSTATGCAAQANVTVTVDTTSPTAGITNNTGTTVLTCATTAINVSATGSGTYSWSGGLGTGASASITLPGTYTVTVTSANECSSISSITITQDTTAPMAEITNSTGTTVLTCATTAINVTATGGGTYSWSGGLGTGASASITSPGTYTVTVISANGCSSTSSITLTQDITLPTAYNVTGGGLYCSGGAGVPIGLDNSQSGVNYQLYRDASSVGLPVSGTGSSITFGNQTAVGTYTVKATNSATSCIQDMTSSAIVTVGDTEKPKITQCLPDGTADCVKNVPAGKDTYQGFYDAGGRVTDNCTPFVDLKVTFADVIDPNSGCKLKRTYTIADISGNEATCTQLFTITDTEVPVINSVVNLLVSPNNNSCGASLSVAAPTDVNENCSLVDEGAYYEYTIAGTTKTGHGAISDIFPEGTTLITWTIADVCGHVSLPKTQTVEVAFSLTPFSYDNGSTAIGIGSGVQPMQTSTHDYFVDNKAPESGYTYSWGLYADNGGVPGAAIDPSLYTLSNVNQAHVQLAFKSNIPTNNYIISVIKTKNATTCTKQQTIQISVQSNSSFDVSIVSPGDQCQAPGINATTMIRWNVNFPAVSTEPFRFNYEIKMDGTAVSSGSVSNIAYSAAIPLTPTSSGSLPYLQYSKNANSYTVVVQYTFYSATGIAGNHALVLNINGVTDAYQVSEPVITNNTDALQTYGVPVITFE